MARYTGPKTRIARKFGEAIFGDDKAFEEVTHLDNTGWQKKKKSEYASS
jgi:small subunit ribosomal protein S4